MKSFSTMFQIVYGGVGIKGKEKNQGNSEVLETLIDISR